MKNGNKLSETIESAVKSGSFSKAIIIGGTNVVGSDIEDWVMKQIGYENVLRLSGSNRYKTSSQIADWVSGKMTGARFQPSVLLNYINVGVANGANDHFPDALSGGALCGHNKAVLLLTKDSIYNNNYTMTQSYLPNKETVKTGYLFGGSSVLSENYLSELRTGDFSQKELFVKPS